jgi:enoyl-CoA hydratase/carnithine racemase
MTYEDLIVTRSESWVEIRLNRPDKLNAMRERTAEEILDVLHRAEHDRSNHAVLFEGDAKAFCTGIDTSEFELKPNEYFDFYRKRNRSRKVNQLFRELPRFSKPVICAIEGYALGGGLELALLGDLVVLGANAKLGLPEVRLGLMPGGGGTQTLPRLVGPQLAKELLWTGRRIGAQEAKEYRLANRVVDAGKAMDEARALARQIAKNAPLSIMLTKAAVMRGADLALEEGMAVESDVSFMLYFSNDRQEGLAAFREKRDPRFEGE